MRECQTSQGTLLDPESWNPGCPFCPGLGWGWAGSSLPFMLGVLAGADRPWGWSVNCGGRVGSPGSSYLVPLVVHCGHRGVTAPPACLPCRRWKESDFLTARVLLAGF